MFGNTSVVIPAWNEQDNLPRCIQSIYPITNSNQNEIIVVGDKNSIDSVKKFPKVKRIHCTRSMTEAMNIGISQAKNDVIVKIDADIAINPVSLIRLIFKINSYDLISCPATTKGSNLLMNLIFTGRDCLLHFAPLKRSSHGNTLIFRKSEIKKLGSFQYDTKLHFLFAKNGKKIYVDNHAHAKEYRKDYSISFCKKRQIESGIKRCQLGVSFARSLFHSLCRGRPFVIAGWLQQRFNSI